MNTDEDEDEKFYRDTEYIAFPRLNDRQLAVLEPLGERRVVKQGEVIFRAGERDFPMALVCTGELEVYETRDEVEQILATPVPGDFVGEVSMLDGTSALGSLRGKAEQSEILLIPAAALKRALAGLPGVGEPIVQAFMMRRKRLLRDPDFAGLRVVAHEGCRAGHLIDDFLDKNHIPHRLIHAAGVEGVALCERKGLTYDDLPVLIAGDGTMRKRPAIVEVARVAGLLRELAPEGGAELLCDLAIVGAGPAGLAAAVNAASEGLETVVLESFAPGGQAGSSSLIENFFGFPTGISGGDLTNRAQLQAYRFGANFSIPSAAAALRFEGGEHPAVLTIGGCGTVLKARCVIVSSGAQYNKLEAEGRERFEGMGVFYAATKMEAKFCHGVTVFVVGAGNSAGQAAMFLSEVAAKVILIVRGGDLTKSMSSYLSTRVETKENIEILRYSEIRKMSGESWLEEVVVEVKETEDQKGEQRVVKTPAVFSMIGANPCTGWLPPEVLTDARGFVRTGAEVADAPGWNGQERGPYPFETSVPGVFAAGDVRSGSVKRCGAAVGEGSMAIENVHQVLGTYA